MENLGPLTLRPITLIRADHGAAQIDQAVSRLARAWRPVPGVLAAGRSA